MAFLLTLAAVTYVIAAVFLSISATSFGLLLVLYLYTRHRTPALPHIPDDELLSVTVQLPVYNEVDVVARLRRIAAGERHGAAQVRNDRLVAVQQPVAGLGEGAADERREGQDERRNDQEASAHPEEAGHQPDTDRHGEQCRRPTRPPG